LRGAPLRDPAEKVFHARAFAPHQPEEFGRIETGGIVAEERLQAPLNVRRFPRAQAVAFSDDPVVAQSVEHRCELAARPTNAPV